MNTVFKTYMQVWVLWGVAAGPVLAWLLTRWRPTGDRARAWVTIGVRAFVALLVCRRRCTASLRSRITPTPRESPH